jgi:glycosyltransferase involved in cell wall biosynthesis
MNEDPPYRLLSVIVPVYNERNTVGEIIRRMKAVELPLEREIIVVDDGSVDGTDKILAALEDSTIRVLSHPSNRGKGAAVRTGTGVARGDVVLIQDADLEYDPQDWPRLLTPLLQGRTKVVYGSRYLGEREATSLRHWIGDRSLSVLTALLFNATLSDIETGYKLVDRRVLDSLDLTAERFDFEPEITAKLLRARHRIVEVPVSYARRPDHERKFTWRDGLEAARTLVRLRLRLRAGANGPSHDGHSHNGPRHDGHSGA